MMYRMYYISMECDSNYDLWSATKFDCTTANNLKCTSFEDEEEEGISYRVAGFCDM